MNPKKHGTSDTPVQHPLRWNVSRREADRICNFNRHYAESFGSAFSNSAYTKEFQEARRDGPKGKTVKYYDSVTGGLLFEAPKGRTHDEFYKESKSHGWPSFRDREVNWELVRCLPNGECVSITGTHLGHNLPDHKGNRYCINLCSIAGNVPTTQSE
jgi:peptide methionine sulfoxide reductase MsrB